MRLQTLAVAIVGVEATASASDPDRHRPPRLPPEFRECEVSSATNSDTDMISEMFTASDVSDLSERDLVAGVFVNRTLPLAPIVIPTIAPKPTPSALDTSISYALSDSCLLYLTSLVSSTTFVSCLPFSLLLTTSSSFNNQISTAISTNNYTYLNNLLAYTASPQPSSAQCDEYFSGVFSDLLSNCARDIAGGNAVATEAKMGVGNYAVMRMASKLVDPSTGIFCYLAALASARPDDLYLWMLSSGNSLPSTSTPTCSMCSALLLEHLGDWSSNTTTINTTVLDKAISAVSTACGGNFISNKHLLSSTGIPNSGFKHDIWSCLAFLLLVWTLL